MTNAQPRRELAVRQKDWAKIAARALARRRVQPNTLSTLSVLFSVIAAGALLGVCGRSPALSTLLPLVAAACVQLRLLCNLLDGMVAIEGGLATRTGPLFNEIPDRISDAVIFVAVGYALPFGSAPLLGWSAALLATGTAYVRLLGGTLLGTQSFAGPMAKQQRMAAVTVACCVTSITGAFGVAPYALYGALCIVVAGTVVTLARRVHAIGVQL